MTVFSRPLTFLWNRGFRMLGALDAIALFVLMGVISFVRFGFGFDWDTYPLTHYAVGFSIATAIHLTVNYFAGLYEREPRLGRKAWFPKAFVATAIGVGVQGLAFVALDRYLMPRLNLAVFLLLASFVLAGNRALSRRLAVRRQGPPRVVLTGEPAAIDLAAAHLAESDRNAVVVDRVVRPHRLTDSVVAHDATDVLLLDVTAFGSIYPEPLNSLELAGVGFLQRVSARETLLGLKSVREIGGMPFVALRGHTVPTHKVRLKRIFDLVLTVAFSPIWITLIALLALYVRVFAGGPVLYRQKRVGRDGANFDCIKFRTMVHNAEEDGRARLATLDDDRIVPALRWMRAMRADELPQLWNVLKGEMSLVGPRPERPELVSAIEERVPGYVRRSELPPGLTGLAQVQGRYGTDAEFKLGYDIQYLVNWSLVLDVQILFRTIWVVLSRRV
ncbi:putative undecaprenyl-phosphate glycosylphosphotransferase [Ilumatobacter coccineus YM16-304]|uniref:Putative undecaprenyl-phosphate glycosylphosphotransferase n=1 Tax=Ilumatobacter coccineus (strain NBRC 103263 / KCTC 29153 / YM16-304) TaxID=1313172 RepID=A0A6C7E6G9_ILUCY|nr:putative undecaprenyl-phosphate glycosylphosphotransferase [Ilumatobacter coccineus YM16-304]